MKIGFILPCYNEYENLFILINQIKKIFKHYFIIVVDDSSTDEIKNKIKKYKNIKYFKRKKKSGRGSAVLFGMNKILKENKIKYVVEMDTDLCSPSTSTFARELLRKIHPEYEIKLTKKLEVIER